MASSTLKEPGRKNLRAAIRLNRSVTRFDRSKETSLTSDSVTTNRCLTRQKKGIAVANNGYDGNFYIYPDSLPEGAIKMGILFTTGRLALITTEYRDVGTAGWDKLIKESTEKYGPALGDNRTAVWNDGTTVLSLRHELNGNITITLEDLAAMSKYSEQQRAALPKL